MPLIQYIDKKPSVARLATLEMANAIIQEYAAQGFSLTLRQLFYQFVARDLIPNTQKSYKNLGAAINDGRLLGIVDWNAIVDRTRGLVDVAHWNDPAAIIRAAAHSFRLEKWAGKYQRQRVEVWIEKDALVGVIADVCTEEDVPYFSCRGYTSQSEMWAAAMRIAEYDNPGRTVILHLGDHDPSGIDMTRDIEDRLNLFGADCEVVRIALNQDQIEQYNPPPNPCKITDSRAGGYISKYGSDSWELDALEPRVLADLIESKIYMIRDEEAWEEAVGKENTQRNLLTEASQQWGSIASTLKEKSDE